jgi:hypothetical protein
MEATYVGGADNRGMARPLRFVPPNSIVEVTTRTMQGRLLLRPSPELTEIILGIIGKAQNMHSSTNSSSASVAGGSCLRPR